MAGEMHKDDLTREEYPLYFAIADALGGTVEPFDVYQGPYVAVGSKRIFLEFAEQSGMIRAVEDGFYTGGVSTLGPWCLWDDAVSVIESARVTLDPKSPKARLEYLRQELRDENISYGELHELQTLAEHIDPEDVELLQAAGVPEFPVGDYLYAKIEALSDDAKNEIIKCVVAGLYMDIDGNWDADNQVSGADYIDHVCSVLGKHALQPE